MDRFEVLLKVATLTGLVCIPCRDHKTRKVYHLFYNRLFFFVILGNIKQTKLNAEKVLNLLNSCVKSSLSICSLFTW